MGFTLLFLCLSITGQFFSEVKLVYNIVRVLKDSKAG